MTSHFTQCFCGKDRLSLLKKIIQQHILGCSRWILVVPFNKKKKKAAFYCKKTFTASLKSSILFTVGGCYPKKRAQIQQNKTLNLLIDFRTNWRDSIYLPQYITWMNSPHLLIKLSSLYLKKKKLTQSLFQNIEAYLNFYSSWSRTKITDNKNTMYGQEAKSPFVY